MAITGRFEADFQSFYQAVDRANAKLTDFQSGAGRVETSLNRMVDSFSGRRLIQEVTLSAEAVERIGGSSKLTQDELQKLAAKASEAVAKMKAMGVEVPPQISALAGSLKPVHEEVGFIGEQVAELGQKFIAAFAVERVAEFVLEVGKAQQQLLRLSKETQIDVEELQTLTAATREYGLENEQLARALYNVSKGIQGGDESVATGLHLAGISLDEVRDKHGKELFLDIERGLSTLTGSLRDTAAADIYGAKLGSALAGFSKEADEAVAQADKLNSKLSRENVEQLAAYASEIERLEHNLSVIKDTILGGVAGAINSVTDAHNKGLPWWKLATAAAKDYFAQLTGQVGTNVATEITRANVEFEKQGALLDESTGKVKEQSVELSKEMQAVRFLATLRADSAKEINSFQLRSLEQLRDMGQLNQQNASAIGVGVDQFKNYVEQVRQAEASTKLLTATTLETTAQIQKLNADVAEALAKRTGTQTDIELAELQKREDAEIASVERRRAAAVASLEQQHAASKENLDRIASDAAAATAKIQGSFDQLRDGVGVDFDEIRTHSQAALDDAADRALKTLIEAQSTVGVSRAELDKLTENYRKAAFAATAMGQHSAGASEKSTVAILDTNKALVDQLEQLQKIKEVERSRGGSAEVTAANFDQISAPQGLNKSAILALLKQGFSMSNAVEILRAQLRGAAVDLSKWPEDVRGPRVPGFEGGVQDWAGGKAIVGEHGPELLDLPAGSSVIPLRNGRNGGGGIVIQAPVYVTGVFDPSTKRALSGAVGDSIMRRVLSMTRA